jgi:hypothetical protein
MVNIRQTTNLDLVFNAHKKIHDLKSDIVARGTNVIY